MDSSSTSNSATKNALTLTWAFGFNKDIVDGVHSLCADGREALFYVAAHTGVIYDYTKRTQELLQGHCNPIGAVAVSHNKKWVATADAGRDSMMVVWDTASGTPIKSIFNPHPNGVLAMDISADALFIVTLSNPGQSGGDEGTEPQTISLWEWTHPSRKEALFTSAIDEPDIQKMVKFNQSDVRHIITTGEHKTMFWSWEHGGLRGYIPKISRHDFKKAWFEDLGAGGVTSVSFAAKLPLRPERDSEPAFTVPDFIVGTRRAYAVACEASAFEELDPERRRGSVLLQGMVGSVTCVAAHPLLPRLMVLCDSGDIHLWDYNLKETGLLMAEAPRRIEQSGLPTALMWHPLLGSDFEDRLVTANNEYKLKQWNADNKSCRRTTLGPTFGGPINRLEQINHIHADGQSRPSEFVAYGTGDKVVGLALTGDSSNTRINGRQSLYPAQFAEEVLGFEDHRQAHSSALSDGGSLAPSRISRGG